MNMPEGLSKLKGANSIVAQEAAILLEEMANALEIATEGDFYPAEQLDKIHNALEKFKEWK